MATYTFGVAQPTEDEFSEWLIQSISRTNAAQEALALNNEGEPVAAHYYQKTEEVAIEALIPEDATGPTVGGTFTFGGNTYYCTGFTKNESNSDYQKFSINAKRFITTALPAAAE